jgi:hypothetical protein
MHTASGWAIFVATLLAGATLWENPIDPDTLETMQADAT